MSYLPERELEPPEDNRIAVYACEICEEPIYVGDDYFDLPDYGKVCCDCMRDARKHIAEAPYDDRDYE